MNSNRIRLFSPNAAANARFRSAQVETTVSYPVNLEDLPPPLPIAKISPDQLIEDILIATLRRVQGNSSPEVAAAAARYITLLTEKAL